MRMRPLGRTGVLISEFALGTMTFGKESDERAAHALLDHYVEAGGNLIDSADVYQYGAAEELVGGWLRTRPAVRGSLVLASKCGISMGSDPNAAGLSRHWIVQACEASLRRLGVDHLDLYQAHCWDPRTPIEESLAAFDDLVHAGKVRYVGVSNFTGWQLQRAVLVARQARLAPVVALQPQYSLLAREIEWELVPVCLDEGLALLPWGPLAQGWLSGKYSPQEQPSGTTRLGEDPARGLEAYDRRNIERTWRVVEAVRRVAGQLGTSMACVALRWVADRPGVAAPILGARTVEQLAGNLAATDLHLDDAQRTELDAASRPPTPDYPYAFIEDMIADRFGQAGPGRGPSG
jgi:aryl-alcohol dehydrogenase-like predicted oxidoreductase